MGSANADLLKRGDDINNITWLRDANYADGLMTWSEADDWADQLELHGYIDFRLASLAEMRILFIDHGIRLSVPGIFINLEERYWVDDEFGYFFEFRYGANGYNLSSSAQYQAWAVRAGDSDPSTVPIPASIFLLCSGLAGIIGIGRRVM